MRGTEAVVIGGGVIGASTAYQLAKRGIEVTLIEARQISAEASGASAGGVRQQGRDPRELEIAMRAIEMWPDLAEELQSDLDYHQHGNLLLVENEDDLRLVERRVQDQRDRGLDIYFIGQDEVREIAPGVGEQILGGGWCPTDGHANPIYATRAFANAARRHGARILEETEVTGFLTDSGRVTGVTTLDGDIEADWVVNAAGAWASGICGWLDIDLPIEARGLQMIVTEEMPLELFAVLGCVSQQISLKQVHVGKYLIGGGWPATVHLDRQQPIGQNLWESVAGSARAATTVWPALRNVGVHRVWSGIEAIAEDGVPILGPVDQIDGLILATGFSGHGFALAPYIGVILADLVTTGESPVPIDDLMLGRFAGVS